MSVVFLTECAFDSIVWVLERIMGLSYRVFLGEEMSSPRI